MDYDIGVSEVDVVEEIDQFLLAYLFSIAYLPALLCLIGLEAVIALLSMKTRQQIDDLSTQCLPAFSYMLYR